MNVIKTWIDKHFYDFNEELLERVQNFLDKNSDLIGPITVQSIKKLIRRNQERIEKKILYTVAPSPPPILPSDFATCELSLHTIDTLEIARQMTLRDEQIYKSIRPRECMNQAWNKENKHERAPNILKMIDRFNKVRFYQQAACLARNNGEQTIGIGVDNTLHCY